MENENYATREFPLKIPLTLTIQYITLIITLVILYQ